MPIVTQINLLKKRRTKIVATLGPASATPEIITQLVLAGVNVFRLNMSHGDHDFHRNCYKHIRSIADTTGLPIAILADLCGPKIRAGKFANGEILLQSDGRVTVTTREVEGTPTLIPSQYAALASDVTSGSRILINDGHQTSYTATGLRTSGNRIINRYLPIRDILDGEIYNMGLQGVRELDVWNK